MGTSLTSCSLPTRKLQDDRLISSHVVRPSMCNFGKRRWLVTSERLHPPTAIRLNSHVPLCQPHVSTLCGDSTSDHPASRRLLSPRQSSAILPECTNPFNDASSRRRDLGSCEMPTRFGFRHSRDALFGTWRSLQAYSTHRSRRKWRLRMSTGDGIKGTPAFQQYRKHKRIGYLRRQTRRRPFS